MASAVQVGLQQLVERARIRDLMARYYAAVDRRDFKLLRTCFTEDVRATYNGELYPAGRNPLVGKLLEIAYTRRSMHYMQQQYVELAGQTAAAETYAITCVLYVKDGKDVIRIRSSRYLDEFRKEDRDWRIARKEQFVESEWWTPVELIELDRRGSHVGALHRLPDDDDAALHELREREALEDVLRRYSAGIFHKDSELIASCFTPDVHGEYHVARLPWSDGRDYIVNITKLTHALKFGMQTRGQCLFDIQGDRAATELYTIVYQLPEVNGKVVQVLNANRYLDHFEKRDGQWLITDRVHAYDWTVRGIPLPWPPETSSAPVP